MLLPPEALELTRLDVLDEVEMIIFFLHVYRLID